MDNCERSVIFRSNLHLENVLNELYEKSEFRELSSKEKYLSLKAYYKIWVLRVQTRKNQTAKWFQREPQFTLARYMTKISEMELKLRTQVGCQWISRILPLWMIRVWSIQYGHRKNKHRTPLKIQIWRKMHIFKYFWF